jgi:spore coat protein A, manganese oxidase
MKRKMLKIFGLFFAILTLVFPVTSSAFASASPASASIAFLDPLTIPKFENQLAGPLPVYDPTVVKDNNGNVIRYEYTVTMSSFMEQILPSSMNLLTPVWGYGGIAKDALTGAPLGYVQSVPGPSFEAVRNIPIQVKWVNNITSPFMFQVDPTIHWADPNNNGMPTSPYPSYPPGFPQDQVDVPTVPHLHGSETQSYYDGTPDEWFTASGQHGSAYSTYEPTDPNAAVYYYPNSQPAAALWYHDHALGLTRINVMSGLAGDYFLRDPNSSKDYVAPLLPSGKYEMPLIIQDRTFHEDGSLWFPNNGTNPDVHPYWVDGFLGNTIMVNGKVWPNMNVDAGQYRFRLLDASNSRFYFLSFVNTETNATIPFTQIGSDGGYLRSSVPMTNLTMAPAERADIIVDFSGLAPGTKILVKNSALTGGPSDAYTVGQVMQLTVTANTGDKPNTLPTLLNPTLSVSTYPNLPAPTKTRILTMFRENGPNGPLIMLLNGQKWDGIVSELPVLGTTEDWIFVDLSNGVHPLHLHLIQFQIVSRQNFDAIGYASDWLSLQRKALGNQTATPPWPVDFIPKELPVDPYLNGTSISAPPNEQGWKDTVLSYPFEVTVIRVRFASQDGAAFQFDATQGPGYVWHCHILDHEDNEMMRPYKVVNATSPTTPNLLIVTVSIISLAAVIVAAVLVRQFQRKRRKNKMTQAIPK